MRHVIGIAVLVALAGVLCRVWPNVAALRTNAENASAAGPAAEPVSSGPAVTPVPTVNPLRVLFIGNSHTYYNDLPGMIAQLAAAAKVERPLLFAMEAAGGATLAQHLAGTRVRAQLGQGHWDYVVLQEQQQVPSFTFNRAQLEREFYAPARTLDVLARASGAKTVLYMTWAKRAGDPDNVRDDSYDKMQERVRESYAQLARELDDTVAPVGVAWRWALQKRPELPLWAADGSHASLHGSYLAACVLYSVLYAHSALDNPYTAGLPRADADLLQRAADVALLM
jgi:hypothetical protein